MLKFVLFAMLVYLLLRAVLNLGRAMRSGAGAPDRFPPGGRRRPPRSRQERRAGGHPPGAQKQERDERATRLRDDEEDVEDARWEDL